MVGWLTVASSPSVSRDTPSTTCYPFPLASNITVLPSGPSDYPLPVSATVRLTLKKTDSVTNLFRDNWNFFNRAISSNFNSIILQALICPDRQNRIGILFIFFTFKIVHNCIFGRGQFIMKNPGNAHLISAEMCSVYFVSKISSYK